MKEKISQVIGVEGREDHDGADQGIGEYGDY